MSDLLGIDLEKLPRVFESHHIAGTVTKEAGLLTGLRPGTPVVAGGLDAACAALGCGVYSAGMTQEQGGQAGGMSICTDKPVKRKNLIFGHVFEHKENVQYAAPGETKHYSFTVKLLK